MSREELSEREIETLIGLPSTDHPKAQKSVHTAKQ